jgi:uncharacterized protein (TIGR03435 family)
MIIGLVLAAAPVVPVRAQLPKVEFDVASIRLHDPESPEGGIKMNPDGIDDRRVTLYQCVREAFQVPGFQISNADALERMLSERYDVIAKTDHNTDKAELMLILRSLLAERFQLKVHRETREVPVFALITGKKGTKLATVEADGESSQRLGAGGVTFRRTSMSGLAKSFRGRLWLAVRC